MAPTVVVCAQFFLFAVISLASSDDIGEIEKRFFVDFEETLHNRTELLEHLQCVIDKGPCDTKGQYIKDNVGKFLDDACQHCSPQLIEDTKKIFHFLKENHPEEFAYIVAKWDPTNEKTAKIEKLP